MSASRETITCRTLLLLLGCLFFVAHAQLVEGALQADTPQLESGEHYVSYTFTNPVAQAVAINLFSGTFRPYLMVVSEANSIVSEGAGTAAGTAELTLTLEPGTYRFIVMSVSAGEMGTYTLTLQADTPLLTGATPPATPVAPEALSSTPPAGQAPQVSLNGLYANLEGRYLLFLRDGRVCEGIPDISSLSGSRIESANPPECGHYRFDGATLELVNPIHNRYSATQTDAATLVINTMPFVRLVGFEANTALEGSYLWRGADATAGRLVFTAAGQFENYSPGASVADRTGAYSLDGNLLSLSETEGGSSQGLIFRLLSDNPQAPQRLLLGGFWLERH